MEKLFKLKEAIENNTDLSEVASAELVIWGSILEDGEVPVKNFKTEIFDPTGLMGRENSIKGQLLLTEKRILFVIDGRDGSEALELGYEIVDSFFTDVDEDDKSQGVIIVVSEGSYYTFSSLMRFGLSRWEEYVGNKIKEFKVKG